MTYPKIIAVLAAMTVASCEPPVQGYQYRQPSGFSHSNSYVAPTTGYSPPPNNYLPSSSFGSAGYDGGSYSKHENQGYDHHGDQHSHGHGHENEVPKSYEFGYSVKDAQSGNDYNRRESSDGNVVRGEYRVQLPDGRTQIVTYYADWKTGFHADVRYEGEARYPEPTRHQQQGGYNYNTPNYSGSLTGFHGNGNSYKPSTAYGPPGYQ